MSNGDDDFKRDVVDSTEVDELKKEKVLCD